MKEASQRHTPPDPPSHLCICHHLILLHISGKPPSHLKHHSKPPWHLFTCQMWRRFPSDKHHSNPLSHLCIYHHLILLHTPFLHHIWHNYETNITRLTASTRCKMWGTRVPRETFERVSFPTRRVPHSSFERVSCKMWGTRVPHILQETLLNEEWGTRRVGKETLSNVWHAYLTPDWRHQGVANEQAILPLPPP